jgi:predicted transcriptional regulator of viral defense system
VLQVRLIQLHQRGDIARVSRGVDRLTRFPASPLGQYMEAALWPQVRRPDAHGVISHESALAIYGLSDASPARIHVTLPTGLRIRRAAPKHLILHDADLTPTEEQPVEGVPVTTPSRAIRDAHASHLGPALIRQAIDDGRRTGQLALDEADRALARDTASRGSDRAGRSG